MNDKNTFKGSLMKDGVILWAVFTKDGKAALHMDSKVHTENGKIGHGALLASDLPVLYEILTPDDTFKFLSLILNTEYQYESGYAFAIRERMIPI